MSQMSHVLVTGGAGYIGSHILLQLKSYDCEIIVYDNLSSGNPWAVNDIELIFGDLADEEKLEQLFRERRFDVVIHLAASIIAPESVADPLKYYYNNTAKTLSLLEVCARSGVGMFVFSSSAAVYGIPAHSPVREDALIAPISPYGASKAMSERMIMDLAAASPLRYVILRYFNVAGADPAGRVGQAASDATHLIKVACEVAHGKRPDITVFGDDYPTPDGTCVRDYIHVDDLARAHLAAVDHLDAGGDSAILNVGYGRGSSVLDVIDSVKRVSGVDFPVMHGARRPGDPPALIADNKLITNRLGWEPIHDDLDFIISTSLAWEKTLTAGQRKPIGTTKKDVHE